MSDDGTDIHDCAANRSELLSGLLRHQEQAEDVEIELLVKMLRGHIFKWGEIVNAGVVYQDVQLVEFFVCFGKQPLDVGWIGNVGLDGHSRAAVFGDFIYNTIGCFPARRIVDNDGCAFSREVLSDGGTNSLRGTVVNCSLAEKVLGHDYDPLSWCSIRAKGQSTTRVAALG